MLLHDSKLTCSMHSGLVQTDLMTPHMVFPTPHVKSKYLDYLLLECTDTAYPIVEDKFETALSHHERVMRDHMDKFLAGEKVSV